MHRLARLIFAVLLTGLSAAASAFPTELKDDYQVNVSSLTSATLTASQVRDAVVGGALAHGWALKSESPGRVVLTLNYKSRYKVEIAVSYDETHYSIAHVASENLQYADTADGVKMIDNAYYRWLSAITKAASAAIRNAQPAR